MINGQRYDENEVATDTANLSRDSYTIANDTSYNNNIINSAGIKEGALVVNGEVKLTDSIVNGYNTALYLKDKSQLIAKNTIFNGGVLKGDVAVIRGDLGDNDVNILGNSIINGNVCFATFWLFPRLVGQSLLIFFAP